MNKKHSVVLVTVWKKTSNMFFCFVKWIAWWRVGVIPCRVGIFWLLLPSNHYPFRRWIPGMCSNGGKVSRRGEDLQTSRLFLIENSPSILPRNLSFLTSCFLDMSSKHIHLPGKKTVDAMILLRRLAPNVIAIHKPESEYTCNHPTHTIHVIPISSFWRSEVVMGILG